MTSLPFHAERISTTVSAVPMEPGVASEICDVGEEEMPPLWVIVLLPLVLAVVSVWWGISRGSRAMRRG